VEADDSYWRRPPGDANNEPPHAAGETGGTDTQPGGGRVDHDAGPTYPGPTYPGPTYPGPTYQGPPPTTPPPTGWQPPHVIEPPPPRRLPPQDLARMDEEEASARSLTRGVGLVVVAILVIVLCALCGRAVSEGTYRPVQTMWAPLSPVLKT
jgi:hypothetical protein